MNNNLIITISRQYGTGGREIGQKLALRLGIPFYDRELITRAAKKTGFDEKLFEQPQEIEPQQFAPFLREGFTVVEWGGTEVS